MQRRESIPALTGVRFLAAAAVVFHHTQALGLAIYPEPLASLAAVGRDGVDLFFVLSGFVLAYNYLDWFERDLSRRGEFLWIRVARIYPLHLAALLLMTPITLLIVLPSVGTSLSPSHLVSSWILNLGLVHAWFPLTPLSLWNAPSWSISVEMLCYLFFPLLALRVLQHITTTRRVALALALCWLGGAALLGVVSLLGISTDPLYYLPVTRVWEFGAGAVLGAWHTNGGRLPSGIARKWLPGSALGFLALPLSALFTGHTSVEWYLLVFPLSVAFVAGLVAGPSPITSFLGRPWLVRLGDASYALYLLHGLPLIALATLMHAHPVSPVILVASIALTLAASLAVYRWFEVPARRWLRAHRPRVVARSVAHRSPSSPKIA